jgi:hypothetical protein
LLAKRPFAIAGLYTLMDSYGLGSHAVFGLVFRLFNDSDYVAPNGVTGWLCSVNGTRCSRKQSCLMRSRYRAVPAETEEKHIIPVRISRTVVEIKTRCPSNAGEAHYSYANLFVSFQHRDIVFLTSNFEVFSHSDRLSTGGSPRSREDLESTCKENTWIHSFHGALDPQGRNKMQTNETGLPTHSRIHSWKQHWTHLENHKV